MTSVLPSPEAPGPNPGQPGHYAHHDWLTASVKALDDAVAVTLPPGVVSAYAGPAAPAGYLLCEGQAVGRGQYPELFAAIGVAFGAGDGSTTFGIPDLRQRVPVGRYASAAEFDTLGEYGGAAYHTLSAAEMPNHAHAGVTATDYPDHAHAMNGSGHHNHTFAKSGGTPAGNTGRAAGGTQSAIADQAVNLGGDHTHAVHGANARHTHGVYAEGGGAAHNNLQPYAVLNYIIKT